MNDQMFSVGEIIQSEAFKREAPDEMNFLLRRMQRTKKREQSTANRKVGPKLRNKKIGIFPKVKKA